MLKIEIELTQHFEKLAIRAGGIWKPGHVLQPDGSSVWSEQAHIDCTDIDLNKFATSLVRECIYCIEFGMDYTDYDDAEKSAIEFKAQDWCRGAIKEKFDLK